MVPVMKMRTNRMPAWMPSAFCILVLIFTLAPGPVLAAGDGDSFRGKISEVESTGIQVAGENGYALIIGVSHFKDLDPKWDLKYADDDAIEMCKFFLSDKSYVKYTPDRIYLLLDEKSLKEDQAQLKTLKVKTGIATYAGVRQCWSEIMGKLQAGRRENQKYFFTLYMAGHMITTQEEELVYLTADAKADEQAGATAESPAFMFDTTFRVMEMADLIRVTMSNARGVMVIVDTCYSGQLKNIYVGLARFTLALSKDQAEPIFLLSSARDEASRESARLGSGHGVFTYYMVNGLESGNADSLKDNLIKVGELHRYVCRVLEENLIPQTPQIEGDQGTPLGRLAPGASDETAASVRRQVGAPGEKPGSGEKPAGGGGGGPNPFVTGDNK